MRTRYALPTAAIALLAPSANARFLSNALPPAFGMGGTARGNVPLFDMGSQILAAPTDGGLFLFSRAGDRLPIHPGPIHIGPVYIGPAEAGDVTGSKKKFRK